MGNVRKKVEQFRAWASQCRSLQWLKSPWRMLRSASRGVYRTSRWVYRTSHGAVSRLLANPRFWWLARAVESSCSALRGFLGTSAVTLMYLWLRLRCLRRIPARVPLVDNPLVVMLVVSDQPLDVGVEGEAKALVNAGFRVSVLCPEWFPATAPPCWGVGIEIEVQPRRPDVPCAESTWLYGLPLLEAALVEQPWAYYAHGWMAALPAVVAAAEHRVLCVCSVSSDFEGNSADGGPRPLFTRWCLWVIERLTLRCANRVVSESAEVAVDLHRRHHLSPNRRVVVGNAVGALTTLRAGHEDSLMVLPLPKTAPRRSLLEPTDIKEHAI